MYNIIFVQPISPLDWTRKVMNVLDSTSETNWTAENYITALYSLVEICHYAWTMLQD